MNRGEIWLADLPSPHKRRPVVLVSRAVSYETRELLTVAPITSRVRPIASHVLVGIDEGIRQRSAINCDRLLTVHRSILRTFVAPLSERKVEELDDALRYALGLD